MEGERERERERERKHLLVSEPLYYRFVGFSAGFCPYLCRLNLHHLSRGSCYSRSCVSSTYQRCPLVCVSRRDCSFHGLTAALGQRRLSCFKSLRVESSYLRLRLKSRLSVSVSVGLKARRLVRLSRSQAYKQTVYGGSKASWFPLHKKRKKRKKKKGFFLFFFKLFLFLTT